MSNYDRKHIAIKINRELPIIIVYNYLALNPNKIHPNAIKNKYILEGELLLEPIDLEDVDFEKDKAVKTVCFFHDTMNDDSTNFVLPKEEEATIGKKEDYGNFYKCFSCQHSKRPLGVIDFYMVMRFGVRPNLLRVFKDVQKEYWQSVEELSALMGIKYDDSNRVYSDEEKMKFRIQSILKRTADLYHKELKSGSKEAKRALAYLFKERGFNAIGNDFYKIIDSMKIGFAPKRFNSTFIYEQLKKEGYTDEELLASKVVRRSSKDPSLLIDFHKNGIIIPYLRNNAVYNIYCRQFTTEKKFRHMRLDGSVEYPVNFEVAKKFPFIIAVEGEIDFLTFKALGFDNVICVGGTNGFKTDIMDQILYEYDKSEGKNCRTVYLCMDGEEKGDEAVVAIGERLLESGLDVRVMRLRKKDAETGEIFADDPNAFLEKFGMEAKALFQTFIDEAISYHAFNFLLILEKEKPKSPSDQLGFIRRNHEWLNSMNQDEKLFLALEIAEALHIDPSWLLSVWKLYTPPTDSSPSFHKEALDKHWVVLFNDKEMAEVCRNRLPNVVFYEHPQDFIQAAKNHGQLRVIVLHKSLPDEYKDVIYYAFPNLQYQLFIGEEPSIVEELKKYEFMALFRKGINPYVNEVS